MAEDAPKIENIDKLKENLAKPIQAAKARGGEIVFENDGKMVVNNRQYQRNFKRLWRAPQEGLPAHFYTRPKKTRNSIKKNRKAERQNKKKGRK